MTNRKCVFYALAQSEYAFVRDCRRFFPQPGSSTSFDISALILPGRHHSHNFIMPALSKRSLHLKRVRPVKLTGSGTRLKTVLESHMDSELPPAGRLQVDSDDVAAAALKLAPENGQPSQMRAPSPSESSSSCANSPDRSGSDSSGPDTTGIYDDPPSYDAGMFEDDLGRHVSSESNDGEASNLSGPPAPASSRLLAESSWEELNQFFNSTSHRVGGHAGAGGAGYLHHISHVQDRLRQEKCIVCQVPEDGDCLLHCIRQAVLEGVVNSNGNSIAADLRTSGYDRQDPGASIGVLRQRVAEHLLNNPQTLQLADGSDVPLTLSHDGASSAQQPVAAIIVTKEQYIEAIKRNGVFMGGLEVRALAEMLIAEVVVITGNFRICL